MSVVANYQVELATNAGGLAASPAVIIGPGTSYSIIDQAGLFDLPDLRTTDSNRGDDDGVYSSTEYMNGRTVRLTIGVKGTSESNLTTLLDALHNTTTPNIERVLTAQLPGWTQNRFLLGKVRRRAVNTRLYGKSFAVMEVEVFCAEPRWWSGQSSNVYLSRKVSIPTLTTGGGTSIPYSGNVPGFFIADFNATLSGDTISAHTASQTSPKLISDAAAQADEFVGATIPANVFYRIRTNERTAIRSDTSANVYGQLTTFSLLRIPVGGATWRSIGNTATGNTVVSYWDLYA